MDNPPPLLDRRVRIALIVCIVLLGAMVVLVTPYNLRLTERGMLHPYRPPPLYTFRSTYRRVVDLTPHLPVIAALGTALASIGAGVWLRRTRKAEGLRTALHGAGLVYAVGLAVTGQAAALNGYYGLAGTLYALAAVGFGAWAWLNRERLSADLGPVRFPRRTELLVLALIVLVTVGARYYELRRIPYGIEGDEAKWTAEVAGVMVDHMHVLSSGWHFGGVPGSFYMQTPFHYVFGPSLLSARTAVATFSILAALVFYWFVRSFFNVPIALLSTGFLSVSLLDLSASRLALVEGHNKLWVIAGPALLMLALRHKRWWIFALAGAAFGLGIVTYDTYLPMLGVGVGFLLVETVFHFWQRRRLADVGAWAGYWAAFALALMVFFGRALYYINGRGGDYKLSDVGWTSDPFGTLLDGVGRTLRVFAEQVDNGFLHTRKGPLISSALVPLVAIAAVGCLVLWRRRQARLPVFWAVVAVFPVPVVLHVAYPRVLYPSLPALYLLAAIGAYWLLRTAWDWLGKGGRSLLAAALVGGSVFYGTFNLYVYFNEVHNEDANRVTAREMSDFLVHYAQEDRLILVPYQFFSGDLVAGSGPWYDFYLRQRYANGTQGRFYQLVPYEDLFVTLTDLFEEQTYQSVGVLVDTNVLDMPARDLILTSITRCYRPYVVWTRDYARLYLFSAGEQHDALCYSARLTLAPSELETQYLTDFPPDLHWEVSNGSPMQISLDCQRQNEQVLYIEAEDFEQLRYYQSRIDAAPDVSGWGLITDEPGSDVPIASTTIDIDEAGSYAVWARSRRIRVDDYPVYLIVGDRIRSVPFNVDGPLNEWVWELVGEFELPAGESQLAVTRPYRGEKPPYILIDAFAVTDDPDYRPDEGKGLWKSFTSGRPQALPTPGVRRGVFEPVAWEPGNYRCRAGVWDGERLQDDQGTRGVWSDWISLTFVDAAPGNDAGDESP